MTREKATEYIAKCTGTPYSRMSSPPDPEAIPQHPSVVGGIRAEVRGGLGGTTAIPTAADRYQRPRSPQVPAAAAAAAAVAAPTGVTSVAMAATGGDRGTILTSSPTTAVLEKKEPRRKFPDEVLTGMTPAASGTAPPIAWGAVPQQQQVSKAPEPPAVPTETSVYATSAYAPPPPPQPSGADHHSSQNLGYYWEDGVWKVWQGYSSESTTAASDAAAATTATAKMPPPLPVPVQQITYAQAPQPPYPPPTQAADRGQYQYQYQFHYPPQQPQQPSVVATSTAHEPSSYMLPHVPQPQHLSQQPPQIRAPPPGLLPAQGNPGSSTPAAPGTDPMVPRYMIWWEKGQDAGVFVVPNAIVACRWASAHP
jgi:hypothetical protein